MDPAFRHQCLIYEGSPSRQLPALAAITRQMLDANYRCLYLNSPVMVAGMSSYLAAAGVDVHEKISKTSLVLLSDRTHLSEGSFDAERMVGQLEQAVVQAMTDGYKGLFATGDMSWEFGTKTNFHKLLEYERRLEELFRKQPMLCGICQYHRETLPPDIVHHGLLTHPKIFVNETLSRFNHDYVRVESVPI